MKNSNYNLLYPIISKEILISGDYKNAERLINKEDFSSEKLAEIFYILGNNFFSEKQKLAAELSWKKSKEILIEFGKEINLIKFYPKNFKKKYKKIIFFILSFLFFLYAFLIFFFERETMNFQAGGKNEMSYWEEWWDTGRPSQMEIFRRYSLNDLWPLMKETFGNLTDKKEDINTNNVQERLKRWLEFSQIPRFNPGPTDNHALIARGLFEAREFEEAISTLVDSKNFAETPKEFEKIYQDLGTVFYYRGYKLKPDGLANYNINDVRKSVESYEKALLYGSDPYLYGNLGWGYYLLKDFRSSIKNSLKALKLRPELNYVRMNLGIAYLKMQNYEMAVSAYASILNYNPQPEEFEGGIRDIMELQIEKQGNYPFANFILGQLYWQQGLYDKSKSAFKIFINQKFYQKKWNDRAQKLLDKMESD